MAHFYSNENFPLAAVRLLRALGHDVVTTKDLGRDGQGVADTEVLALAITMNRCVLTSDLDFIALHRQSSDHCGIIHCTSDGDFQRLARHIDEKAQENADLKGKLLRVYRGH
ncbi:MAG: hypothetical protein B7Z47_01540 [Chthoniobacter sp. 12-60-6]|nr:MAG: hypothetical protein B7Z47_01540 [Chthoniobacter sp. 12-60-6]